MRGEKGSALPLAIGLASVVLAFTLCSSQVISLYDLKLRTLADARLAVLYIAKQAAGVPPVIGLDYSLAARGLDIDADSMQIQTLDGKTFEAQVCVGWHGLVTPKHAALICESARARVIA